MRRLFVASLSIALAAALLGAGAMFSTSGARWGLRLLEGYLPLTAVGVQGSVAGGLRIASLRYADRSVKLMIEQLELSFAGSCLVRGLICVERFHAVSLAVEMNRDGRGSSVEPEPEPVDFAALFAGVPELRVASLRIGELRWLDAGRAQTVSRVRLRGRLGAGGLRADGLAACHALGCIEARAELRPEQRWSVEADWSTPRLSGADDPRRLPASVHLSAQGSLKSVELEATAGEMPGLRVAASAARDSAAVWRLQSAQLYEQGAPVLSAAGTLGALDALAPDLQLTAQNLRAPRATGLEFLRLDGRARLAFQAADPRRTWRLTLAGLRLEEGDRSATLTGTLRASDAPRLPAGRLDARVQIGSGDKSVLIPVSYTRQSASGAPAEVSLPEGLRLPEFELDAVRVEIRPGAPTRLRLQSRGDLDTELALSLRALDAGAAVRLEPFSWVYAGQRVSSRRAIDARWLADGDALQVGPFCFDWRANRACASAATLGSTGSLPLTIEVREAYSGTLDGAPFAVTASGAGHLTLRWRDAALESADFALRISDLAVDPFAETGTAAPLRWDFAQVRGRIAPSQRELSVDLRSPQLGALRLQGRERDAALSGRLRASDLRLSALADLVPEWSVSAGRVDADLALGGTRSAPEARGELRLSGGAVTVSRIETPLDDVDLRLGFLGRELELSGTAALGGGKLRFQGACCRGGSFAGTVRGTRNRLRLPQGLDAVFSPDLALSVGAERLNVTGELRVHDGVYTHSQPAPGGIARSDDVHRLDTPEPEPSRLRLDLDLRTLIEPGFTLRSRALEATLSGDLRLRLPAEAPPSLFGDLKVLGGELRAFGQTLRLSDGDVGFVGDPFNPDLDISAERFIRADDQRVGFRVSGALDAPRLQLFSDPPRPDNEALSYLLRGRPPEVGASADSAAMALALGASAINRAGLLSSLNAIPGLSDVALGARGSAEDTAATISAYLGKRLYLSYGVGIYEPVNALTARLYLRSRLWLEVVSRLERSFDLYYRFDRN